MKGIRNQVAHSSGGIEQNDFNNMWQELEQCLKDLGLDTSPLNELRSSKKVLL